MARQGVTVGTRAPRFDLACTRLPGSDRERVSLDDYQDRWLTLLFYPRDFSLVCPTELTALSSRIEEFAQRDCDVLGVSTDSVETHERWIATPRSQGGLGGLKFPLAADEDGAACQTYGVYLPRQHVALRGLFIIDPNGVLQYQVVHNLSVGRRAEEVIRVLDALQTGGLCPENWTRDEAPLDPTRTLRPNSVIGQFQIEASLGSGSFGTVFRARDLTLERTVALKVFHAAGRAAADALLREARAAAALNHPNVCTIFAVDAGEGAPMIVMEYVEGEPLSGMLTAGPLSPDLAAAMGRQVAAGMAAAHARGIVHGDLKPGNILVTPDGTAKVMDFGLAHRDPQGDAVAETGVWVPTEAPGISGTPSYMSPEQARGEPVGPAGDVFSFGLVLYEMVTGRRAVSGDNVLQVLRKVELLDADSLAADQPEPFRTVLRGALVADPGRRELTMARIGELLG
jgi:alkyl hydroperoxide reductase subunit AhpC